MLLRKLSGVTDGSDVSADVAASPRSPASSQCTRTDSDPQPEAGYDEDDVSSASVHTQLRLALASLALGWVPGGAAGAAALRARREAWATEHGLPFEAIDDEADPTEGDEEAMQAAEASHFWDQLDHVLEWR